MVDSDDQHSVSGAALLFYGLLGITAADKIMTVFSLPLNKLKKKGAALLIFKCYIKCFKAGFPITSEFTNQFYAHVLSTSVMIILHFN